MLTVADFGSASKCHHQGPMPHEPLVFPVYWFLSYLLPHGCNVAAAAPDMVSVF